MIADGYNPEFDHDYEYGHQGELVVDGLIAALKRGDVRIEDKHKSPPDANFYIEEMQDPGRRGNWKPSGVRVTTADYWAYVVADTGVIVWVPVARLLAACDRNVRPLTAPCRGDNPTRGRVVHFELLTSQRCDP
jgi:hypothetical protein